MATDNADASTYVIWSNEHRCWWGPDRCGYRAKLEDAGRYAREDAIDICIGARGGREYNHNPTEVPLLLKDASAFWPDDKREWERARREWDEQQRKADLRALGIEADRRP
jgi:hypothetical protein